MGDRIKHSGPHTRFCALCLSGEHERVDEEVPAPFIPPAHYRRDDGVDCCVHTVPVGPNSCPACRELADEEDEPPPSLPSAISQGSQWCWEPLDPHRRVRVRIAGTRWDGQTWWVETEALEQPGRALPDQCKLYTLDTFIESAVAVDHV